MRRREFIPILGSVAASVLSSVAPRSLARAQAPSKATRGIGVVTLGVPQSSPLITAFISGLRELGYEPGKNMLLEFRNAEGPADRLAAVIADVIARNVGPQLDPGLSSCRSAGPLSLHSG